MNYNDIFIFVIGSFGEPVYYDMIKMRKLQLAKYDIPHMFLFDGPCPSDYTPDSTDVFFDKPEEPFPVKFTVPYRSINPHMIIKFLKAVQTPSFDPYKYKFIVRLNLSTFINFPKLLEKLATVPTSRMCMAPDGGVFKTLDFIYNMIKEDYKKSCCDRHRPLDQSSQTLIEHYYKFKSPGECCELFKDVNHLSKLEFYLMPKLRLLHGAVHVFTPDFIEYFSKTEMDNPNLYVHNDDLVLSFFAQKYGCEYVPLPYNADPSKTEEIMVRIKNIGNRQVDLVMWKYLLKIVDQITYDH